MFTPQLIVNGVQSMVGSQENEVQQAVAAAGQTLETFNDVTQLRRIGAFRPGTFTLDASKKPDDGIAVFVPGPGAGRIWGAASN